MPCWILPWPLSVKQEPQRHWILRSCVRVFVIQLISSGCGRSMLKFVSTSIHARRQTLVWSGSRFWNQIWLGWRKGAWSGSKKNNSQCQWLRVSGYSRKTRKMSPEARCKLAQRKAMRDLQGMVVEPWSKLANFPVSSQISLPQTTGRDEPQCRGTVYAPQKVLTLPVQQNSLLSWWFMWQLRNLLKFISNRLIRAGIPI